MCKRISHGDRLVSKCKLLWSLYQWWVGIIFVWHHSCIYSPRGGLFIGTLNDVGWVAMKLDPLLREFHREKQMFVYLHHGIMLENGSCISTKLATQCDKCLHYIQKIQIMNLIIIYYTSNSLSLSNEKVVGHFKSLHVIHKQTNKQRQEHNNLATIQGAKLKKSMSSSRASSL